MLSGHLMREDESEDECCDKFMEKTSKKKSMVEVEVSTCTGIDSISRLRLMRWVSRSRYRFDGNSRDKEGLKKMGWILPISPSSLWISV